MRVFFLPTERGQRFCVLHQAEQARAAVLVVPPFAEELNKSRRMMALVARALAAVGLSCLIMDLEACGDSEGALEAASWSRWLADLGDAIHFLAAQHDVPLALLGLRSGALLAAELAQQVGPVRMVLWQPVGNGDLFLSQFLRLKLAAEVLGDAGSGAGSDQLKQQLLGGEAIEVAGYHISPQLAQEISRRRLNDFTPPQCPIAWLELASEPGLGLSPAAQRTVDGWRAKGAAIETQVLVGPPFWLTAEITECPSLVDASADFLARA